MTSGALIGHSGYPVGNLNSMDSWASPKNAAPESYSLDVSSTAGTPNTPSPMAPDQPGNKTSKNPNQAPLSGSGGGESITIKLQLYGFQNPGSFTSSKYSPDCVLRSEMLEPAKYATMPITFNNVPCDAVQQNAIFSKFLTLPGREEFLQLLQNMSDCAKDCEGSGTGESGVGGNSVSGVSAEDSSSQSAIRRRFPATDAAINKHWLYNKTDKRAFCFSSRVVLEGNYLASRGSSSGHLFVYLQLFRRHFWVRENLSECYDTRSAAPSIKSDVVRSCISQGTGGASSQYLGTSLQQQPSEPNPLPDHLDPTQLESGALSPNNSSNSNADSTFISLVNTLHNQQHHQQRTSCESPTSFCSPNIGLSLTSGSSNDSNFSDSLLITGPQGSAANDHRKLLQPQTSQSIASSVQQITTASSPIFQTCQINPVCSDGGFGGDLSLIGLSSEDPSSLQFGDESYLNNVDSSKNSEAHNEHLISQLKDPGRIRAIEQKQNFLAKQHLNDLAESSIKASSVESSQQVLEKFFRTPAPICSNWDDNDEPSVSSSHNDLVSMVQRKFRYDRIPCEETLKINTGFEPGESGSRSNFYHLINENNNTISSHRNSKHGSKLLKLITDKHGLVSPRHFPTESPNNNPNRCHLSASNNATETLASSFANIKQEPLSSKCDQIIVSKSTQIMLNLLDLDKSKFRKKQSLDSNAKNLPTNLLTSNGTAFNSLAMHPVNSNPVAFTRNLSAVENEQIPGNLSSLPVDVAADSRRRPTSLLTPAGCEHEKSSNTTSTPSYFNGSGFFQIASAPPTVNPAGGHQQTQQQQQPPTSHVPRIIAASSQRTYSSASSDGTGATTASYHVASVASQMMTSRNTNAAVAADVNMLSPSTGDNQKSNSKKRSRHSSVGPKAKRSSFDHCISPANNNLGDACNVHNTDCSNFFGGNLNSSPLNCNLNSNDFESPVAFSNNTKTSSSSSSSRKASNHNSSSRVNGNDVITGANGVHRENSKGGGSLISSSYNISPPLVEKSGNNSGSTAISQNNDSSTDSLLLNIASDSNHNLHTQQSLDDLSLNCFQFNASDDNFGGGGGNQHGSNGAGSRQGGAVSSEDTSQSCENLNDVLFPEFEEFETMITNTDLDLGIESPETSDNQNTEMLHNEKNQIDTHLEELDGGLSLSFSDPGFDDQGESTMGGGHRSSSTNAANFSAASGANTSSNVLNNMAQHFVNDEETRQALASVDRLLDTEAAKDNCSTLSGAPGTGKDRSGARNKSSSSNRCLNTSQDSGVLTEIVGCLSSSSSNDVINNNANSLADDAKDTNGNHTKMLTSTGAGVENSNSPTVDLGPNKVKHERMNPKVLGNKTLTELLSKGMQVTNPPQKSMEELSVFAFTSQEELSNQKKSLGKEYPSVFLPRISENKRKIISEVEKIGDPRKKTESCRRAVVLTGRACFSEDVIARPTSVDSQNDLQTMQVNDGAKSLENFSDINPPGGGMSQDEFLETELNAPSIDNNGMSGYRENSGNQNASGNGNGSNSIPTRSHSDYISAPPLSRIKGPREVADELLAAVRQEEERVSLENEQKAAAANCMTAMNMSQSEMSQTGGFNQQNQHMMPNYSSCTNSPNDTNFHGIPTSEQNRMFQRNTVGNEFTKGNLVDCNQMESMNGVVTARLTSNRNFPMQQVSPLAKTNETTSQQMNGGSNMQMNMMQHPVHSMQQTHHRQPQMGTGSCEIEYKPFPPNLFRDPVNPPNQVVPNSNISGSKLRNEHNGSQLHHQQLPPQIFVPDHCVNPPPSQSGGVCTSAPVVFSRAGMMPVSNMQQQVAPGQQQQQTCVNKFYSSVASAMPPGGACNAQFVYASPTVQTQQNQTGPMKHDQILGATSVSATSPSATAASMQQGYFHKRFVGTAYQPSVVGGAGTANPVLVPQQRMMLRSPIEQPGAISPVYANIAPHSPHLVSSPTGGFQRFPDQPTAHHRQNYHVFSLPPPSLSHHHHAQQQQQHNNTMSSASFAPQRPTDLIGAQNAAMVMRNPPTAIPQVFHASMQQQRSGGSNTNTGNALRKNHLNVANASMSGKSFGNPGSTGGMVGNSGSAMVSSPHPNTLVNGAISGGLASSNHIINLNSNGPVNVSGACSVISQVMTPSSRDMSYGTSVHNSVVNNALGCSTVSTAEASFSRSQPFPQQQPMYLQQNPMQNTNNGNQQPQVSPQQQQACGSMTNMGMAQTPQTWGNVMQMGAGQSQLSPSQANIHQTTQQGQKLTFSPDRVMSPAKPKSSYDCPVRPDSRASSSGSYRGSSKKSADSVGSAECKSSSSSSESHSHGSANKYSEQMEDLNSIYDDILSENSKLEASDSARFNHNFDYAGSSSNSARRNSLFADSPPITLTNFQDNLETMTHQYSRISTEQGKTMSSGSNSDSGIRNNDGILKTLLCSGNNNSALKGGTSPVNVSGGGGTRLVVVSTAVNSGNPGSNVQ